MSKERRCKTCIYWDHGDENYGSGEGECHRNAPLPIAPHVSGVKNEGEFIAMWPIVFDYLWCGDWRSHLDG